MPAADRFWTWIAVYGGASVFACAAILTVPLSDPSRRGPDPLMPQPRRGGFLRNPWPRQIAKLVRHRAVSLRCSGKRKLWDQPWTGK